MLKLKYPGLGSRGTRKGEDVDENRKKQTKPKPSSGRWRSKKRSKFSQLIEQDIATRLERLERAARLQPLLQMPAIASNQRQLQPIPVNVAEESPTELIAPAEPTDRTPQSPDYHDNFRALSRTDYQRYIPRLIQ